MFATSDLGTQSLEVSGDGFDAARLRGENGNYVAHVGFSGDVPPASVKVSNVGDTPVSSKTIPVTDGVEGHATYDADKGELVVSATSTDTVGAPTLTAKGFGPLVGGTGAFADVVGPPASVTVTSAAGGSVDLPVDVTGGPSTDTVEVLVKGSAPSAAANAGPDQTVDQNSVVTLDASASADATKFAWKLVDGPAPVTSRATPPPSRRSGPRRWPAPSPSR